MSNHYSAQVNTRIKLIKRVATKKLQEIQKKQSPLNLIDQSDYKDLLKLYKHEYIQTIPHGREWAYLMGCKASILAYLIVHLIDNPTLAGMYQCLPLIKQRYLIEKHHRIRNCKEITNNCPICNTCSTEVLYKRLWQIVCGGALKQKNINEGNPEKHVCVEVEFKTPKNLKKVVKEKIIQIYDEVEGSSEHQLPQNCTDLPEEVDWPILRETLDCYILNEDKGNNLDEID